MFSLPYHIETTTALSPEEVIKRCICELKREEDYLIKWLAEDHIIFEDKILHTRRSIDKLGRIDGGELMIKTGKQMVVSLEVHFHYGSYVLGALGCLGVAIATGVYACLIFLLIMAIGFIFGLTTVRSTARVLLRAATDRIELSLSEDNGVLEDGLFF